MLIEHSSQIAEFRAARQVSTFYVEMENRQQVELVDRLLERTEIRDVDQVAVLVLDHGVNNGHRLLEPVLPDVDCCCGSIPRHSRTPLGLCTTVCHGHIWWSSHQRQESRVLVTPSFIVDIRCFL